MIEVEGLTKYYGATAAIRDLSFSIQPGEVVGFLGLNGAGKSTTLKVLGCVLLPTSGRVRIDGFDVAQQPHELRRRIGYLPDTPPLYDEMTVQGYLAFVARLRSVPAASVPAFVARAVQRCSLQGTEQQVIGTLSHGYRQRVGVAQALVHDPKLLILDEPTGGLDPAQIVEMRELIRALKGQHTVLVSSHILSEISQVCDRMLVIQQGEIIARGTEAELAQALGGGGGVELEVEGPAGPAAQVLQGLAQVSQVQVEADGPARSTLRVTGPGELRPRLVAALVQAGVGVLRVDRSRGRLESIFLELTHGKAGGPRV